MKFYYIVNFIFVIVQAEVTVKFSGNLDIGQYWNLSNLLRHGRQNTQPTSRAIYQLVSLPEGLLNTPIYETEEQSEMEFALKGKETDIFPEKRKVKDDAQFRNFIVHVYKQHLKVFQKIKKKVTPDLKKDVEDLTNNFRAKFIEFVNNTQNYNIKTKQAGHKVVMNTINTSNNIMKRLLERLVIILRNKGALRIAGSDMVGLIHRQIVQEKEAEIQHACNKLGICKKDDGFSHLILDVLVEMLRASDEKITQARDAFTEVLKEQDFSAIMDEYTLEQFLKGVSGWELSEPNHLKSVIAILKNIIHNKYTPITVPKSLGMKPRAIIRTVGILELLDALDAALPSIKKNKDKFDDIRSLIKQWTADERNDIQEIMRSFLKLIQKGIKKSDKKTIKALRSSINDMVS